MLQFAFDARLVLDGKGESKRGKGQNIMHIKCKDETIQIQNNNSNGYVDKQLQMKMLGVLNGLTMPNSFIKL